MDHHQSDHKYLFRPITEDPQREYPPIPVSGIPTSLATSMASTSSASGIQRMTMSPTRPKLYSCWRRSEEAWSSTGSRHSSRPGSSTASSSRPPSQPNQPPPNLTNPATAGLYCKSNNSSQSDVSVARNQFQQLSVSSRRKLFQTQKWSNSFDQPSLVQSAISSPGRRRQPNGTVQRENKSLDLDSGYSGSSGSWTGDRGQLPVQCCSPLESVKRELEQLKDQTGQDILHPGSAAAGPTSSNMGFDPGPGIQAEDCSFLPSFPGKSPLHYQHVKMFFPSENTDFKNFGLFLCEKTIQ